MIRMIIIYKLEEFLGVALVVVVVDHDADDGNELDHGHHHEEPR